MRELAQEEDRMRFYNRQHRHYCGHVAMRLEPDPLDPVGTGLKPGDVNPEVRDMMLPSTRLCVWNPDMVVPPSELPCHGRRLMVQPLSASHGSLHRSYSPIAIIWPVESAERPAAQPRAAIPWLSNQPARSRRSSAAAAGRPPLDPLVSSLRLPLLPWQ